MRVPLLNKEEDEEQEKLIQVMINSPEGINHDVAVNLHISKQQKLLKLKKITMDDILRAIPFGRF